ncbi:cupin domain-containing protein [Aestuariibacter sp. A3R04]|uniref:cupin domain-containing protein n=1 Tax=Aestuariibacter sp. A3R04 TaxID=2841571 RepID=UPI001C08B9CB|nr:cupin domain-containing protein [Aestuariibacter sp. A3R04]MBU3020591.1 cupin domain-containing protein [Aestuariibacter sp. A3R04]
MLSDAKDIIQQVLSPLSYDVFFDDFVGRRPALVNAPNSHRNVLGGHSVKQQLLKDFDRYAPTLTCHANAPKVPPPKARAVSDADAFYALIKEYFALGYTVRIPDVIALSEPLSLFTRALEKVLQTPVNVVAFWSAPGASAPVHHDEVDVIVIQLEGTKRWFISDTPTTFPNRWKKAGELPPAMPKYKTVDVKPGDFIYLPRGTAHTVESTSESIHLSIGFVPLTTRDVLNAALDHLSDLQLPLRKDFGPRADNLAGTETADSTAEEVCEQLQTLLTACQDKAFIDMALQRRRAKMILDLPKLSVSQPVPVVSLHSKVKHNPMAMSECISTENIVDFTQPGEQILVHLGAKESLDFIRNTRAFCIADVPGAIDNQVRVALVQRLVNSGFLQVE